MCTNLLVPFGNPTEENNYNPFIVQPSGEGFILFHGTTETCALSIATFGFNPTKDLKSSSFARSPGIALGYACSKRSLEDSGAVIAVIFKTLDVVPGIRPELAVVYLDDHSIQPLVLSICIVPQNYNHV